MLHVELAVLMDVVHQLGTNTWFLGLRLCESPTFLESLLSRKIQTKMLGAPDAQSIGPFWIYVGQQVFPCSKIWSHGCAMLCSYLELLGVPPAVTSGLMWEALLCTYILVYFLHREGGCLGHLELCLGIWKYLEPPKATFCEKCMLRRYVKRSLMRERVGIMGIWNLLRSFLQ